MPDTEEVTPTEGTFSEAFGAAQAALEATSVEETSSTAVASGELDTQVAAEPSDEATFTIKVDGEERSVTQSELVRLAQQGDDYTRKTQALAAEKQQLAAAQALVSQLRDDPTGTIEQLREMYGIDIDESELDLDPDERRIVEMDRRLSSFEEDRRQQAIGQELSTIRQEFGEFDEGELITHALNIGTTNLRAAYRDMTYETAADQARAAREAQVATEDATAVEAKRQAQLVEGGHAPSASTTTTIADTKRSFSDLLREALAGAA